MVAKGLILAAALGLAACQTTARGTFCDVSKPIRLRAEIIDNLSAQELKDILALNEKGAKLCGWRP